MIVQNENDDFQRFPVEALPAAVRRFVTRSAEAIGCDPSYVALPLLSALAAAIGTTRRIRLKRSWTEPAIIWTAVVGESGTLKTPAFKMALAALRKAQSAAFKDHAAEMKTYEAERLKYESDLTAWKRIKGDAGDPPEKPEPPVAQRFIVSDTTVEALAPILQGNPRGILLGRDELSGWFGSFDRYAKAGRGGADSANWLSMHNAEQIVIDRKSAIPPTIYIPSAAASVTGGIQPRILGRSMSGEHTDSGMLARLLFSMPPRAVKSWTEAEISRDDEKLIESVFGWLLTLAPDQDDDGDDRPRLVKLSPEAKRIWVDFYNEHGGEMAEMTGDLAAAWSKLEGYAARLALVVHLARWAGDEEVDPGEVDADSISSGITLSRWFGVEARRVYSVLCESDDDREHRRLLELLERRGGNVSGRELVQSSRAYKTVAQAEDAIAELVEAGHGSWQYPTAANGRPAARRFVLFGATPNGVAERGPEPARPEVEVIA